MNSLSFDNRTYTPIIFSGIDAGSEFLLFRTQWEKANGALIIVDDEKEQAKEYGLLRDPSLLKSGTEPESDSTLEFIWIVIPWRKTAVRTLAKDAYRSLRSSRNHDLLTKDEASILSKKRIGIAGLNVGNPAAICLAQEGIGSYLRMADNDTLSLSNLNRFRASIADLGVNKAVLSARQAYEIDPFLEIDVWENGVSPESLSEFVKGIDLLIEEMDAPPLKLAIREEAKRQHVPTIMITGNGHDIILDIERFDTDHDLPLLSGKLTNEVKRQIAQGPKNFKEKVALAQDFMGKEYLCERLNSSFQEVGETLIGIPQLAEASFLRGAVLAHACRGILLGEEVKSGRYAFGLSDLYNKPV
ncbi:MAG: hypothetical protein A2845_02370 [Candidatus Lloydbacteria bacterium RIFCSPHIGHO2_01_FULL_49_22]|uniref:THIF-type NAD/FAD binding fold domain-containing protein n=1 Tax=Candidatus Lloydbacteria bacterium RIFCSPHIGHO2_01_FULL_49_22 TaxID=1798658 RepID=A0A1G2CWX1_9BACT|nr:MAG: hypothetical protein A2845_02370 [Candidatus Lloydbacteria bacterium RIFCSPHIGHO2_01_FULL_49_22]OGZ10293.1 MAG: hypothetical protein A3C14_02070 [Candidatus Lloydbacteria bacterium RIFCSPHIGHO2_02_FULL_50_18]